MQPAKVFISYTHESNDYSDLVLKLANQLRHDGIDADLDQYHHSPPEGWPRWMDQRITWADLVLVLASPSYLARVMGTEQPGKGLGIRWEGNLIYQHLYNAGSNNEKFIPVVLRKSDIPSIPMPLQGSTHYSLEEPGSEYQALLSRCRGLPRTEKPPLGKPRPLGVKNRKTDVGLFFTSFISVDAWNKAKWAGCAFLHDPALREPPTLALVFGDQSAAEQIFQDWRQRLGPLDAYNELRISIVVGDVPNRPHGGYSVHIGSNIENIYKRADDEGIDLPLPHVMTVSRVHYMTPSPGSTNLALFRKRFEQFGSYRLIPAVKRGNEIVYADNLAIHKRHIEFRNVRDISSLNDPDSCVLP